LSDHHQEEHQRRRRAHWLNHEPMVSRILENGAQEVVDSISDFDLVFVKPAEPILGCIDERVGTIHPPIVHVALAASGMLYDLNYGREALLKLISDHDVMTITSHDECGAAAIWTKTQIEGGQKLDLLQSDHYLKDFCQQVAEQAGIGYQHIPMKWMAGGSGLHPARAIYISGPVFCNLSLVLNKLPLGFLISLGFGGYENTKLELLTAIKIAFGDHGHGDDFTAESPLLIVPIGDPAQPNLSVEAITTQIKPILAQFGDRIHLTGFTAPKR
jgi:hypothetical protein